MKRCPVTETCPNTCGDEHIMCKIHWARVPHALQQEVYYQYKRHRGKPSHLKAIQRAIAAAKQA